jgi:hypothetical protein
MNFPRLFLSLFIPVLLMVSCSEKQPEQNSVAAADSFGPPPPPDIPPPPPVPNGFAVQAKTYEVVSDDGKSAGWGYDLFVGDKRVIHQDIIPALSGNNHFRSQADAQKTGDLAAQKMKQSGSLPTITIHDLDSLKIAH